MMDGTVSVDAFVSMGLLCAALGLWTGYAFGKAHGIEQTLRRLNRRGRPNR